ncbi:MAG: methyltransferase [Parvularculaceae bacterium]
MPKAKLPMSMRERWIGWRNSVIANPRFQRWAAAFPVTKPIADKHAGRLFDVCAGFVYSQILSASAQLNLFDMLAGGALTVDEIAAEARLPVQSAETLLRAGAALGLFEETAPGRFALGEGGAALLGNSGVLAMIAHHDALYRDLADPVRVLRDRPKDTRLAAFWRYPVADNRETLSASDVSAYSALMAASQSFIAEDVLEAYSFAKRTRLLDIGGGAGAFLSAALGRHKNLEGILFDLPAVADIARERIRAAGFSSRVRIEGGDFYRDALPEGADIASLIRVLHDHDDDPALAILKAARAALPPHGALVIAEPMAHTPGAKAMGDAYFGLYLLAMGSGRPRSRETLSALVRAAGFRTAQFVRSRRPLLVSVLVAKP